MTESSTFFQTKFIKSFAWRFEPATTRLEYSLFDQWSHFTFERFGLFMEEDQVGIIVECCRIACRDDSVDNNVGRITDVGVVPCRKLTLSELFWVGFIDANHQECSGQLMWPFTSSKRRSRSVCWRRRCKGRFRRPKRSSTSLYCQKSRRKWELINWVHLQKLKIRIVNRHKHYNI